MDDRETMFRRNVMLAGAAALVAPGTGRAQSGAQAGSQAGPQAGPKPEKPRVTIGIGGSSAQIYFLAINAARTMGLFTAQGLDPEFVDLGSGAKGLQALVGGSSDIGAGAFGHTIQMQAKRVDVRSIVLFGQVGGYALGVNKALAGRYKTPADMKGWRIAISAPGSETHIFLTLVLAKGGLKPEDVTVIGVGSAAGAVAALRKSAEMQAISNSDPVITELSSSGDITVFDDTRTLDGTLSVFGGAYASGCLYAKQDFIARNPLTVQAVVNAMTQSLAWLQTATPEQKLAAVPEEYWRANKSLYTAMLANNAANTPKAGLVTPEMVETLHRAILTLEPGLRSATFDPARTYDNSFVTRALAGTRAG